MRIFQGLKRKRGSIESVQGGCCLMFICLLNCIETLVEWWMNFFLNRIDVIKVFVNILGKKEEFFMEREHIHNIGLNNNSYFEMHVAMKTSFFRSFPWVQREAPSPSAFSAFLSGQRACRFGHAWTTVLPDDSPRHWFVGKNHRGGEPWWVAAVGTCLYTGRLTLVE